MDNQEMIRLVFTGDITFSNYFQDGWKNDCVCEQAKIYLQQSDYVVANIEGPITSGRIDSKRKLNHASNINAARYLQELHVSIWNLANNHIMDCGKTGLDDTIRYGQECGCLSIGAGDNTDMASSPIILGDSVKVGILSIAKPWPYIMANTDSPGALTWDKDQNIADTIQKLQREVDWIIMIVHGGEEFSDLPFPYIRDKYKALLDLGADIIIAHHPHVVQNYERIDNKIIFYSLGNFIFDTDYQREFCHTDRGILLGIDFYKKDYQFDYLSIRINREKHIVETGENIPVFCDIKTSEYKQLWALEAKRYYPISKKLRKESRGLVSKIPEWLWFAVDIYSCRTKRGKELQMGRIRDVLGKWKKMKYQDIVEYINEKKV